ncbi:prepilin-type N-terminal cleavage/methylation domain-containing protein [Helicobacter sp. 13S00477-4]|uniref:type II secretion system protein n=1 Tax=Helicobacter sp. 13S00477-4 TaxID=1905759 RepID=UPI000BA56962|nr:prepilin-type N-terminal cleavage/methylation domain-containing protein [Helicobacter sp. 13S00477-4]PAF52360.1 hypothetical protein BKH44_02205 [Helicobacter sp. 13S00477-4]
MITASNSNAFSLIELVLAIVIFGIILSVAIPKLSSNEKICEIRLSSKIGVIQNELSRLFTQAFLSNKAINITKIHNLLYDIQKDNSNECFLKFDSKNGTIKAKSYSKMTTFEISPKDFSTNPKIFCNLSNSLCKRINHKTNNK